MLFVGLGKVGSQPATQQEFYGESFAPLAVADLPASTVARVAGSIPTRADGEELPLSVKRQLSEENGQLVFRGWMTPRQQSELSDYKDSLAWQCTVQKLFEASQPKPPIKGKVEYRADHSALSASGFVSDELRDALLNLKGDERWNRAVDMLYELGSRSQDGCSRPAIARRLQNSRRDAGISSSMTTATHDLEHPRADVGRRCATRWPGPTFRRSIR